jgi:putative pyruvate formate lyase activating enzyme
MDYNFSSCKLCPRQCGINRNKHSGICGETSELKAAKACLHYWEEPPISGKDGSGAVFFSGCSLKCCFCQNYQISHEGFGKTITTDNLANIFLSLQEQGANNINLVNPTHYVPQIINALDTVKHRLNIPVVYNSGGYERVDTLKLLDGYIDIYLPDIKYLSNDLSLKYSGAENYFQFASKAVMEMHRQQPKLIYDGNIMKKGLIVRHLILPNCRHDSINILKWLADNLSTDSFMLSLMSQYIPSYKSCEHTEINRKLFTFEYNSVLEKAIKLGIDGFTQDKKSAQLKYIPDFDLSGL